MNPRSTPIRQFARVGAVAVLATLAMSGASTSAHDNVPHPAHIHSGTCDSLGDVVAPLTDIAAPEGDASGPASAIPVESSLTTIDLPLQDIIDGGHAVNVHLSADEIGTYIACGDIGGVVNDEEIDGGKELTIGLHEMNGSGYAGVAWLGERDGKTLVNVDLFQVGTSGAGTPAAEAAQAADAAEASAVEIKGFAFNPPSITIPIGGSITWTNQDNTPHTATALDRAALQSGAIKSGDSFTQTFDAAGTYDYFCEFHPNMKGTIVVQ